jgi:hypothetical protein
VPAAKIWSRIDPGNPLLPPEQAPARECVYTPQQSCRFGRHLIEVDDLAISCPCDSLPDDEKAAVMLRGDTDCCWVLAECLRESVERGWTDMLYRLLAPAHWGDWIRRLPQVEQARYPVPDSCRRRVAGTLAGVEKTLRGGLLSEENIRRIAATRASEILTEGLSWSYPGVPAVPRDVK